MPTTPRYTARADHLLSQTSRCPCLHVSTTSSRGCWPAVCSWTPARPTCSGVRQLVVVISSSDRVRLRQLVKVSPRSRNLLRHRPQHAMPRSENRCQLLCRSGSAAQHSTFDVCILDACRRSCPVPTGLRQRCNGRLTTLPIQPSPVGPRHRHARQLPLAESARECMYGSNWRRSSFARWMARLHHTWLQTCDVCPTCRQDDVCGLHWHTSWMSPSRSA